MSKCLVVRAVSVLVMFAVAGNAWANPKPRFFGYEEWEQAVIELQLDPREVVYPFEATPEMMAWAEEKLQSHTQKDGLLQLTVLQNALFNTSYSFVYDNMRTLTAADAFAAREGNCISFTSLFVAISRGLGYPTFLASVRRDPGIAKTDGVMMQGNLQSARRYLRRARWSYGKEPEVYDALARLALHERDDAKVEKYSRHAAELRRQ